MAFFEVSFRAQSLNMNTFFNVVMPETCPEEDIPVIYLLHGMHGNHTSWVHNSLIEKYANDRKIAVIMPDGENSYYTDMKYGKKFYTYIADELVDYTRRVFKISRSRSKTFICGLSMGGYGAVRTALKKPEQYAAAASLSGVLDIAERVKSCSWTNEAAAIWGDDFRTGLAGTDADLFRLIKNFPENVPKPRIYAACGRQDFLYDDNISFRDFMNTTGKEKGFDFRFEEGDGVHNWEFWNKWVVPAIDFMLEKH